MERVLRHFVIPVHNNPSPLKKDDVDTLVEGLRITSLKLVIVGVHFAVRITFQLVLG